MKKIRLKPFDLNCCREHFTFLLGLILFLSTPSAPAKESTNEWFQIRHFESIRLTRSERWSLDLNAEGIATLNLTSAHEKGFFHPTRISDCASSGGLYLYQFKPEMIHQLKIALNAMAKEQEPLQKPTKDRPQSPTQTFTVESGSDRSGIHSISIIDLHLPKTKTFLSVLDQMHHELMNSRVQVLRMKVSKNSSKNITVEFKNEGIQTLALPIPDHASEAFQAILKNGNLAEVEFAHKPKAEFIEIKSGKSVIFNLTIKSSENQSFIREIRFQNRTILHHLPRNKRALELALCSLTL